MKKLFFAALAMAVVLPAAAQDTYESARLLGGDLNGTARYVGMGGAMEALGADISTIATNPAGLGLFRRGMVSASLGMLSQQGAKSFGIADKNKVSFDQVGFVYTHRSGENSFLNFGFNYHKNRNFSQILSVANKLSHASSNKLSYIKGEENLYTLQYNKNNEWVGNGNAFNQIDFLNHNVLMYDETDDTFYCIEADRYTFDKGIKGHINEYDFNISGNINDRVYLGLTVGVKDVNHKSYSEYTENLVYFDGDPKGKAQYQDSRHIEGSGFDVKAGVTFRPVEESPFRIGLYVHTPTWYDLKTTNYTQLLNNSTVGLYNDGYSEESYDFKLFTPWKFGVSLGHTVSNMFAFGATYEYTDCSRIDSRVNTGESYDWYYDSYVDRSESDMRMNDHTKQTLKGVHTVKVGAEMKANENFSVRLGYNFVSSMYDKDGFKDGTIDSPGSYYASSTDFTNWKSLNRITAGVGYSTGNWNIDLAYQYTAQKGDFWPFMNYWENPDYSPSEFDNVSNSVKVENNRHHLLLTLGYRF